MKNYYLLLGIPKTASLEEIENAFQKTSKACASGAIPEPFATRMLGDISEAYEVLKDPIRRSAYDAQNSPSPEKKFEEKPQENQIESASDQIYWKGPDMETDPEADFTPAEYLARLRVPVVIFGSLIAVVALHILCGAWMDPADYRRFSLRSSMIICFAWAGYFAARLSVVSKGWLPIWIGLCGLAHTAFTWVFLMSQYRYYGGYYGRYRYGGGRIVVYIGAFYVVSFAVCFIVAAVFLERGSFTENIRKFGRGRFKKPGW
jgi:hypothetical protein